jgi:TonB family protein
MVDRAEALRYGMRRFLRVTRGKRLEMSRAYLPVWLPAAAVILCLAAGPAVGSGPKPSAKEAEAVEQLDEVEVTASRIAPPRRAIPLRLPDVSTAISLPSENVAVRMEPPLLHVAPRLQHLLRDETAAIKGIQTRARYLDAMRPPYPRRAREMGWEGTVVLRVEINPDGTVGGIAVYQTSGYPVLDEAALTAVNGWRFAPPADGAFTFSAVVDVPVRFDLREYGDSRDERQGS